MKGAQREPVARVIGIDPVSAGIVLLAIVIVVASFAFLFANLGVDKTCTITRTPSPTALPTIPAR